MKDSQPYGDADFAFRQHKRSTCRCFPLLYGSPS